MRALWVELSTPPSTCALPAAGGHSQSCKRGVTRGPRDIPHLDPVSSSLGVAEQSGDVDLAFEVRLAAQDRKGILEGRLALRLFCAHACFAVTVPARKLSVNARLRLPLPGTAEGFVG